VNVEPVIPRRSRNSTRSLATQYKRSNYRHHNLAPTFGNCANSILSLFFISSISSVPFTFFPVPLFPPLLSATAKGLEAHKLFQSVWVEPNHQTALAALWPAEGVSGEEHFSAVREITASTHKTPAFLWRKLQTDADFCPHNFPHGFSRPKRPAVASLGDEGPRGPPQ